MHLFTLYRSPEWKRGLNPWPWVMNITISRVQSSVGLRAPIIVQCRYLLHHTVQLISWSHCLLWRNTSPWQQISFYGRILVAFSHGIAFFLLICALHAYNNLVPDSFSIWASLKLFTRQQQKRCTAFD